MSCEVRRRGEALNTSNRNVLVINSILALDATQDATQSRGQRSPFVMYLLEHDDTSSIRSHRSLLSPSAVQAAKHERDFEFAMDERDHYVERPNCTETQDNV